MDQRSTTAADLEERLRRGEDMANRQLADMERQRDEAEDARRAAVAAAEDLERRLKNGQEMAAKELEAAVNEAAAAVMKLREVENDAKRAAEEGGARIRAHESELEQLRREAAQLREEGGDRAREAADRADRAEAELAEVDGLAGGARHLVVSADPVAREGLLPAAE